MPQSTSLKMSCFTASIALSRNCLCYTDDIDLPTLISNFCGHAVKSFLKIEVHVSVIYNENCNYFLCGNINNLRCLTDFKNGYTIVKPYSYNYIENTNNKFCSIDELPTVVHGVGVYFKHYFNHLNANIFETIKNEHTFNLLTESNKPSNAYRTGVYLSNVEQLDDDTFQYKMLRCSSNLSGATENFTQLDKLIVSHANRAVATCFDGIGNISPLNHVLAQIYTNTVNENGRDRKAKIKDHSDKTKDMLPDGLIAFCTFYDRTPLVDAETTKIRFRLKNDVPLDKNYVKQFDVVFNQNSLFLIPLTTNQLYTHEIIPPTLPVSKIPTRMGYIIRSSGVTATFKDGKTFLNEIELTNPNEIDIVNLKKLYFEENTQSSNIVYNDEKCFSLNKGDYVKPKI